LSACKSQTNFDTTINRQQLPAYQPQQPLTFDLNEPLQPSEDDMGVVDNIFMVLGYAPQQQPATMKEDVILTSSDSKGVAENLPPIMEVADPLEVQVFIPMENGYPLQLLPDDIQENELMDFDDLNMVNNQMGNIARDVENNVQNVGMVITPQFEVDLVFSSRVFELPQPK
jgi:hypothetical protein